MDQSIGAYEAKTRLPALLDRVEKGETLVITRNGRPVARLVPVVEAARAALPEAEANALIERFRALREKLRADGVRPFTADELVGLVRAGRKY